MDDIKIINACRICSSRKLFPYLDLGLHPLANSYVSEGNIHKEEFKAPLAVQLCEDCGLSQLTCVVNPELMFKHYLYVSSTPKTFRDHCAELAASVREFLKPGVPCLALDIASNDGCLLKAFKACGFEIVGVDPAENLAQEANASGVLTICDFWSSTIAQKFNNEGKLFGVITGTNVFAHVDDVHEFIKAATICLDKEGIFVLEFPYVVDFIERNLFDTIYHEHVSYVGVKPVEILLGQYGMEIVDVERFYDLHGGTIRIIAARRGSYPVSGRVGEIVALEERFGISRKDPYLAFAKRVGQNKQALLKLLHEAKNDKRVVWAYGASAKGNTLLNYFEIDNSLVQFIVDDNPRKWGYYTPGAKIPIGGINDLIKNNGKVHDLLLLAWNFAKEIGQRCIAAGYEGDFIYPVPEPKRVLKPVKERIVKDV